MNISGKGFGLTGGDEPLYKMVFNGTTNFATLPALTFNTNPFTVELFVKMLRPSSYTVIEALFSDAAPNTSIKFESSGSGGAIYGYIGGSSNFIGYGTWTRSNAGNTDFFHYVLQRNSATNGQVKVNGLNRATNSAMSSSNANITPNIALYAGSYSNIEVHSLRISNIARYGTGASYTVPNPNAWVDDANTLFLYKPVFSGNTTLIASKGTDGTLSHSGIIQLR